MKTINKIRKNNRLKHKLRISNILEKLNTHRLDKKDLSNIFLFEVLKSASNTVSIEEFKDDFRDDKEKLLDLITKIIK